MNLRIWIVMMNCQHDHGGGNGLDAVAVEESMEGAIDALLKDVYEHSEGLDHAIDVENLRDGKHLHDDGTEIGPDETILVECSDCDDRWLIQPFDVKFEEGVVTDVRT